MMIRPRPSYLLVGSMIIATASTMAVGMGAPQVPGPMGKGLINPTQGQKSSPVSRPENERSTTISDEEALKAAGLNPADGVRLVEYLKQRTLTDEDQNRIREIIKRFGADDFHERVKATEDIASYGSAAVALLKAASTHNDPEIAYRARVALKKLEKIPHKDVAAAAVRAIVKLKPEGAARVLIGFLPKADDEVIAAAIREALVGLAVRDGMVEPSILEALNDESVVRRSAAYRALTQIGQGDDRQAFVKAYPRLKAAICSETDTEAQFAGIWNALLTLRDKDLVPEMINILPRVNEGRRWQIEDFLLQLAGSHPPQARFLMSKESLVTARDAWLAWWKEKSGKVDLARLNFHPRTTGITEMIEISVTGLSSTRLLAFGPDFQVLWQLTRNSVPNDFIVEGDRLLVVDLNAQICECTLAGEQLARHNNVGQILNVQKAADGNLIIIGRNQVQEFNKEWNSIALYSRNDSDILSGIRLPGGDMIFVTGNPQGPNCFRLDRQLKLVKNYTVGRIVNLQWMDAIDDEHILVCEADRVAEYDLSTGKQTWFYRCEGAPTSCQRLFNGNTLIAQLNAATRQVVEVNPSGKIVYSYSAKDNRVARVRRK